MMKLDVTQSAIAGVLADRKGKIDQPEKHRCDGCGASIWFSRGILPYAKQSAAFRGHKLFKVCPECAKQFYDAIARDGGEIEASEGMAMDEAKATLAERRQQFLRGN